jgi:hypothetical protein
MDIDGGLSFARRVFDEEHRAWVACYTVVDDDEFFISAFKLQKSFHKGIHVMPGRGLNTPADTFDAERGRATEYAPRTIYAIGRHDVGTGLVTVYVSSPEASPPRGIFHRMHIADTEKGPRFMAMYVVCYRCNGMGRIAGASCPECKGRGWEHRGGERFDELGAPAELRKLEAPASPLTQPLYESLG